MDILTLCGWVVSELTLTPRSFMLQSPPSPPSPSKESATNSSTPTNEVDRVSVSMFENPVCPGSRELKKTKTRQMWCVCTLFFWEKGEKERIDALLLRYKINKRRRWTVADNIARGRQWATEPLPLTRRSEPLLIVSCVLHWGSL